MDVTSDNAQTAIHLYNKIRENINQFIKKNHYTAIFTISVGFSHFIIFWKANMMNDEADRFSLNTAKNGEETVITFSMNRTINGSYI